MRIDGEWYRDELGIPRRTRVGRVAAGISPGADPERVDRFLAELPRVAELPGGLAEFHVEIRVDGVVVTEAGEGDFDTAARVAAVTGDRPGELRAGRFTPGEPLRTGELERVFDRAPGVSVILGQIPGLEHDSHSYFYRPDPQVADYPELTSRLRELPGVYWASVDLRFRYLDRPPGPPSPEELQVSVWLTPDLVELEPAELLEPVVRLSLEHFDSLELHLFHHDGESLRVPYLADSNVPHDNPPELHALLDRLARQHLQDRAGAGRD